MVIINGRLRMSIVRQEVFPMGSAVKITPSLIPAMEKQLLCATFLEAVIRFYEDPENMRAFEAWRRKKGGTADEPE